MPDVVATIEFLANLPIYALEKPFLVLEAPRPDVDPESKPPNNLEWQSHDVHITDIRGREVAEDLSLDSTGFDFTHHPTKLNDVQSLSELLAYRTETEDLLRERFQAEKVVCYEHRLRRNAPVESNIVDLKDPLLVEGPAKGAHCDVTYDSGVAIIRRYLTLQQRRQYFRHGYRFQIVNTWRSLLPKVDDRPLAFCDYRSIDPTSDLVAADRVLPDRVGEVYYLQHNERQKWYWLDGQTRDELLILMMYDTAPGDQARYCPHVSFDNPRRSKGAEPRHSIETRSIVISRQTLTNSPEPEYVGLQDIGPGRSDYVQSETLESSRVDSDSDYQRSEVSYDSLTADLKDARL